MTITCQFKKSRCLHWVKAVLAFKIFEEFIIKHTKKPAERARKNSILPDVCSTQHASQQDDNTPATNEADKEKVDDKLPIINLPEQRTTDLHWGYCGLLSCRCICRSLFHSLLPTDDSVLQKLLETFVPKAKEDQQNCNQTEQDIFCKSRQLRNSIILSKNMELDSNRLESLIDKMVSILTCKWFSERCPEVFQIIQLKTEEIIITATEKDIVKEMTSKALTEKMNDILKDIELIVKIAEWKDEHVSKERSYENDLDNLRNKITILLKKSQCFENDPCKKFEDMAWIRQHLQQLEREIDNLECVKTRLNRDVLLPFQDEKQRSNDRSSIRFSKEKHCMINNDHNDHNENDEQVDTDVCQKVCEYTNNDTLSEAKGCTQIRKGCTAVKDTVDLKSKHYYGKTSNNDSNDDNESDMKKYVLKEVINGHSEECPLKVNIVAAPVFNTDSESGKECRRHNHEHETGDLMDEVTSPMSNEGCREELLGTCSTDDLCRNNGPTVGKRSDHVNESQVGIDGGPSTEMQRNHVDTVLSNSPLCTNNSSHPGIFNSPSISNASTIPSTPSSFQNENSDIGINTEQKSGQIPQNSIQPTNLPEPEVDQAEVQRFEPLMQIIDKIADGERVPPQITMRYEMLRFCTLRSFPKYNKPFITRIAAAGFYYANTDDEVVCYSCARRKRNWCEDDNPMEIHRELNPNCSFLLRNSEVNVPVRMSEIHQDSTRATHSQSHQNTVHADSTSGCSTISQIASTLTSHSELTTTNSSQNITQTISSPGHFSSSPVDSTNNTSLQNRMHQRAHGNFVQTMSPSQSSAAQEIQTNHTTVSSSSHYTQIVSSSAAMPTSQLSAGGTSTTTAPKYPKYATKTVRLTSFNDCGDIVIPPDSLATSGFFYAGFGDCVRCFQCGVGLRHWSDEDDPWIEHCRWSKDCLFVKQVKGQEFVNLVQMAVQYSQNQNGNGQTSSGNTTGMNAQSSEDAVIEQQMHSNASQSVLEMGYDPNVIRNALRALRNANDGQTISAATLMEKIFELEDEASNTQENDQLVQGTPPSQQNTRSAQDTDRNNTLGISRDISSASSNYVSTQSVAIDKASSSATSSGSVTSGTSRAQSKKSQLLEQKKLKQENEQLKQQSMCTKCKTNDVCIVFLPCGHLVTCETCAPTVRYCSVQDCGKYIKGTVRTYLA